MRFSIRRFFSAASGGAIILLLSALLGLLLSNSFLSESYFKVLHLKMPFSALDDAPNLAEFISIAPMSLFFFVVIAEIKEEIISGHLASFRRVILPLISALGGMMIPACLYGLITSGHLEVSRGWAIPIATDAAFTLPIILALGRHVSEGARVWLMALAIFDDLLGIVVIALFYASHLNGYALFAAGLITAVMIGLNKKSVQNLWVYASAGVVLWWALLVSGLHPTIAGVITGLALPSVADQPEKASPLERGKQIIAPWVTWLILPLFGFVSMGMSLSAMSFHVLLAPVPLGVALGLFLGKPIGVFGATIMATRLKIATLPKGTSLRMLFGLSLLCGIGFTISLFIAELAFSGSDFLVPAKYGILMGSLLSALAGWLWLRFLKFPAKGV
ncbi:Na+/H+ antiporter NhaA [Zymomonas mobilis subsp. mobilis ZM4 = ATCC 31821]|uniref:Na(+)/H(+) antiporter NhaA n=1 Tax=Zymomonas mobilis subsp. mobilis (strain ATCC 31821 / ZM4 / CP4) TaxID=264203 RepID=NHAA_ZYMMO|nr:Na+/H+ antiporter NhaA [Zymomonas mobilis]Q5NRB1.2 RecName: Full=Na(+)/H(+) antiporter NhaA; AltName: Full=Sodium/proton antiporter NhaA [Zymomonas mobilis subsp. mobilis ZM4 = ATCC 31821]AAV88743.2 Na+/H+ antiporter NhaA [Zymomonas mobilis subsp. mobilis ZM4 = ATCC 31821]AVZ25145.1 Na+/H+ antiporter NhaA [Zymomonas mobilis subsp. mobilis]AVZ27036.1 Na+/H+ antiporter NhaA [Zymomonas mobilis subsp. mobilis]AVZ41482.1 Na+/H+ antiporter NhaA [Zymomonas mobilis subsp. mobilis ZM4 = ATCC 31821]